jgi:hypothetical protein
MTYRHASPPPRPACGRVGRWLAAGRIRLSELCLAKSPVPRVDIRHNANRVALLLGQIQSERGGGATSGNRDKVGRASRPSPLIGHCAILVEIAGTSPATARVWLLLRFPLIRHRNRLTAGWRKTAGYARRPAGATRLRSHMRFERLAQPQRAFLAPRRRLRTPKAR